MKLPLYALLFPASQAALLGVLLTLLAEHGMTAGMWILMILLSVLCALCDWLLFRTLKQLTLRRLTEAREQALAESVTMQERRAAALEKEAAEAEAVRAQIRAHLDKAEELLRQRQTEALRDCVEEAAQAACRRTARRCEHPVADAVLGEKLSACERAGVAVHCTAAIPRDLTLGSAELCAVLSNLLDNAAAACAECPPERRFLRVEARVAGGYLTLRVVNSAPSAPVRRPRAAYLAEHGWGLSIVETLAGRSGGRMVTEPGDGQFAVTVWLRAEAQAVRNGL